MMHTHMIKTSQSGVSSGVHYQMFAQEFSSPQSTVMCYTVNSSKVSCTVKHFRMLFCMQVGLDQQRVQEVESV